MSPSTTLPASEVLDLKSFELKPGTTLIEASAGTGKTFTIQYIVLDLLLKGLELESILVVTFTEAATQELRERMQRFLFEVDHALVHSESVSEPLASVLSRAKQVHGENSVRRIIRRSLLHSDEAAIYTIHGFCQRALQENAFAADVTFETEVCADTSQIIARLVRDFQRRVNLELLCAVPVGGDFGSLCERAKMLTGFTKLKQPSEATIRSLGEAVESAAQAIRDYQGEADAIQQEFMALEGALNGRSYSARFFEEFPGNLNRILLDPMSADDALCGKLGASEICSKLKKAYEGTELSSGFFTACETLYELKCALSERFLNCFDTWFIAHFSQYKLEHGIMTYDDMIALLDRALPENPTLCAQLRKRYRAALVDEFQDTDDRQYNIFRTLFASEEDEGDEEGGRYFAMIGDPKQSIYGFRGADIDAYLNARLAAAHRYTLPINYRSESGLIEACNAFFKECNLGDSSEERAIRFESVRAPEAHPGKSRLVCVGPTPLPLLFERVIDSECDKAGDLLEDARTQTASDIAALLQSSEAGRILIETDGVNGIERRPVRPGDVAVLVDTHGEAAEIQSALRRHQLLSVLSKAGDVYATAEATHFLHFLRACLDPREQWIHVLFVSPLYGMTDTILRHLTDEAHQIEHERFSRLGREWQEGASVGKIWSDFLYEIEARPRILRLPEGERLFTNYLHLGELGREMERRDALSPERVADRIFENVSSGTSGDTSPENPGLVRLESDEDAIQIVTLHSSKGLEFPVVFLPSLWQKTVPQRSRNALRPKADPADRDMLIALEADPEAAAQRLKSEILRLGYVGMTRAVHLCVYYNAPDMPAPTHGGSNHKIGWFDHWVQEQRPEDAWKRPAIDFRLFISELESAAPLEFDRPVPAPVLADRVVGRSISDSYQITSYSSLSRLGPAQDSSADPSIPSGSGEIDTFVENETDPDSEPRRMTKEPEGVERLLLEALPGGTRTGTCLHEIIDQCDFTRPEDWESLIRMKLRRHFPGGSAETFETRVAAVLEVLNCVTDDAMTPQIALSRLPREQCLHEMEFYFPVHAVDVAALEGVIESWANRQQLEYLPMRYASPAIDGFLTGSIDLFFEQDGRYYILDWKSNSPLPGQVRRRSSYSIDGMHAHMCHGRYYLQALIYSVAAAAHLRLHLGEAFDWETHVGGFIYCFLRGLGEKTGWLLSRFTESEVRRAAAALGQKSKEEAD